MITPRRIRLFRVPDLPAFRSTLTEWILALRPDAARDTCVIVPTHAAAEQLRRTVEGGAVRAGRAAVIWPVWTTRRDLYDELASRLSPRPAVLSAFEREVLLAAICRELTGSGVTLPYDLRPALVAEILALYDHVRRLGRTVDDFERNFLTELEKEQDTDRGAARLLEQTVFLTASYRRYQARVAAAARVDEHTLRDVLVSTESVRPVRRMVITVADRLADPDGMWPADFDLLSRLPHLDHVDLIATEGLLAAGYIERLHAAFPDIEEERFAGQSQTPPTLIVPASHAAAPRGEVSFNYRDREEELAGVARRLKRDRRDGIAAPLHRTAIVVRRPLPYLYLARDVFADAGIPFEALDTLPLAAEPYAAAVDLALDTVASDFTRTSLLALLRSPHFNLFREEPDQTTEAELQAIAACDYALAEARYLGGLDRLASLVEQWSAIAAPASREERRRRSALPALVPVVKASVALRTLGEHRLLVQHITTLIDWLRRYERAPLAGDETRSRRARVRGAVLGAMTVLRDAFERHDPAAAGDVATVSAAIRRWLGAQTFAAQTGAAGLQVLDAQAARFADVQDVQIVGLIEGEWPERPRRNVLYPSTLLSLLEPLPAVADPNQRERDALKSARAQFRDLVFSPVLQIRLSTFALENDAVVEPSMLLDEVASFALPTRAVTAAPARVAYSEALALEPRRADVLPTVATAWGAARLEVDMRPRPSFQGHAGAWRLPRVSISRLELYLNCPFKFYAAQVLRLEEQPEDEVIQTPLERGRFLHELWEHFFSAWQRRGHGRIEPEHVDEARRLFTEVAEQALASLSPAEAALERQRLLGSAVDPGIAHRVFALEASRPTPIVERLLEFALEGDFTFRSKEGASHSVSLNAKTDRIDVLEDGTLRVIDYKSKNTPDTKVALQLPIYAHLAREVLQRDRGRSFTLGEALYLSFEGTKAIVPLRPPRGLTLDDVIAEAEDRALRTLDRIADGQFPPSPLKKSLCGPCSYRAVCRLEIVEASDGAGGE